MTEREQGDLDSFGKIKNKLSGWFGKKNSSVAVGVDIGGQSIKVVELKKKKGEIFLSNYAIAKGKEKLVKAGASGVLNDVAGDIIDKIFTEAKIKFNEVNVAVPSFASLITTIKIPRMSSSEIDNVVKIEAPKYIPVNLKDVIYGWQIIDEKKDGSDKSNDLDFSKPGSSKNKRVEGSVEIGGAGNKPGNDLSDIKKNGGDLESGDKIEGELTVDNEGNKGLVSVKEVKEGGMVKVEEIEEKEVDKIKVLVVAIMRDISDQYEKVFASKGLAINSLEIDSFSLVRSLIGNDRGCYIILDIGHNICNILFVVNKSILLNKAIDIAGERVTSVIAKSLNVDLRRAEKLKIKKGINIGSDGSSGILGPTLGIIINEIKKVQKVFKEKYPDLDIDGIVLTGGVANMKGIIGFIEKRMGIKTFIGNPFVKVSYPDKLKGSIAECGSLLSVAIGLAMLSFEDQVVEDK